MARKSGGSKVKAGFYWSPADWEIVTVHDDGGRLPGADDKRYHRVPTLGMLALAPLMGAAFVVFLPLIGFGMLARHFGGKGVEAVRRRLPRPTAERHVR